MNLKTDPVTNFLIIEKKNNGNSSKNLIFKLDWNYNFFPNIQMGMKSKILYLTTHIRL